MSPLRARLNCDGTGDGIRRHIGCCLQYAEEEPCEIFATLCIYLNRVTVPDRFSVAYVPNHNKWGSRKQRGGLMHQSTWVVLLLLMFGEIVILAVGGFILWLAGEFGDAPKWTRLRSLRKRGRAQ